MVEKIFYGTLYFTGSVLISMILYGCIVVYIVKNKS